MPSRDLAAEAARASAEEAVTLAAPLGTLFGVYTPADPAATPAAQCVVLFTRPRSHRNRMWVEGARRLAAQGFACFRFDYHGAGDSEGPSLRLNPNQPHRDDALAVLRYLRTRYGHARFLLVGACFDARTALSTFPEESAAIDGIVFFAAPVMELDALVKAHADHKSWRHVARSLGNPDNWRELVRAERWHYMGTVLGRMTGRALRRRAGRPDTPLSEGFLRDFGALVRSGKRALFIYGDKDVEYVSFKVALETLFTRLSAAERARLEVEVWPGDVHGFLAMPLQRRALERALEWLATFHPRGRAHPPANGGGMPAASVPRGAGTPAPAGH